MTRGPGWVEGSGMLSGIKWCFTRYLCHASQAQLESQTLDSFTLSKIFTGSRCGSIYLLVIIWWHHFKCIENTILLDFTNSKDLKIYPWFILLSLLLTWDTENCLVSFMCRVLWQMLLNILLGCDIWKIKSKVEAVCLPFISLLTGVLGQRKTFTFPQDADVSLKHNWEPLWWQ